MRLIIGLALVALCGCDIPRNSSDDDHAAKRAAMIQRIKASPITLPPEFACVAKHVTDATVETQYDVSIYDERPDHDAVDAGSHDIMNTYLDTCGGKLADFQSMVLKDTEGMNKSFVIEMLKAGRV